MLSTRNSQAIVDILCKASVRKDWICFFEQFFYKTQILKNLSFLRSNYHCHRRVSFSQFPQLILYYNILSQACITVEWSLFPKACPILGKEICATFLHKYIATCLGKTTSTDLLEPFKSS